MAQVLYCNRWNRVRRTQAGSFSEEEARRRYSAGESLCVVVLDWNGVPTGFVEVGGGSYGVGFLDRLLRQYLDYVFEECEDRLFLSQAIHMQYLGDSLTPDETLHFVFKRDGTTTITQSAGGKAASERHESTDMSKNWEPRPEFEDIPVLLRENR